jgi:hypothetical protein
LAPRAFLVTIPARLPEGAASGTERLQRGKPPGHFWEEVEMIRKVLYATLASLALTVSAARAEDTIVWWDFLSGGDGVRMKAMLDEFNKEHAGKVKIDATTSE